MAEKLETLIQQLEATTKDAQSDPAFFQASPEQRLRLVKAATGLLRLSRDPMEGLMEFLTGMAQVTVIRLFIKWKVFENIPRDGSISVTDLAEKVGADHGLINRLARMLTSTGVLKLVGKNELALSPAAGVFIPPHPASALVQFGYDFHAATAIQMPKYFDIYGLKEPIGRFKTITSFAYGDVDKTIWEHLNSDPEGMAVFMTSMVAMSHIQPTVGSYDFSWVVKAGEENKDRVLVIDVGGGKGHALKAIAQATPGLDLARCAVEDLEEIIQESKATAEGDLAKAQFIAMDFHKEQPIKGAAIYYIRRCLHDYGDDEVTDVLARLQQAMADDSKILIVEQIIESTPDPFGVAADVFILTIGGKERTVEDFEYCVSRAGLKISEIFRSKGSDVGIIECVKA